MHKVMDPGASRASPHSRGTSAQTARQSLMDFAKKLLPDDDVAGGVTMSAEITT